jgi:hypothetical protein
MMIVTFRDLQQDTIPRKIVTNQDSIPRKPDSASIFIPVQRKDSLRHKSITPHQAILPDYSDTTSVCIRNSIADVTFYDFNNFIKRIGYGSYKQFPFILADQGRLHQIEERAYLVKHLKPGKVLPSQPLHTDWMIIIILLSAFLFSLVKSSSKRMMPYFERFFISRGLNESTSRDVTGLFHWQSTILNLISFLIIGLFGYSVASYYAVIPTGITGIVNFLIALGVITAAITIRHLICITTGAISGQQEVFREYLLGIYHSYRFGAIFLFLFILLMSYTEILPVKDLILSGIFILAILYLIRVIRLLIIFLNRNISIFYLILYLCALEILPVLIIVKYFTGLV